MKAKLSRISIKAGACPDRVDYWGGGRAGQGKTKPPQISGFFMQRSYIHSGTGSVEFTKNKTLSRF